MYKIAVEEAFATPSLMLELKKIVSGDLYKRDVGFDLIYRKLLNSPMMEGLRDKLLDVGSGRLADMDQHAVNVQILSLTAPGVQVFSEARAKALTVETNNFLLEALHAHPNRFYGLMAVSPSSPAFSVSEIERLGDFENIVGIIINSHTKGEYLDADKYNTIFEAAEKYRLPIYLHPSTPAPQMVEPYLEYGLAGPIWGFAAEAGLHAMRLMLSGVFDKYPDLKVILGHLGEGLPFWINRLDSRIHLSKTFDNTGKVSQLQRTPGEYMKQNFYYSTSGMNNAREINYVCEACGESRLLFAIDYPYESTESAVNGMNSADITIKRRQKIYYENARDLFRTDFGLPASVKVCDS